LTCDRGKEFLGSVTQELVKMCGSEIRFILANNSHANGTAENIIGQLKRQITKMMSLSGEKNWVKLLDPIVFSLNSRMNTQTKMSPIRAAFGNHNDLVNMNLDPNSQVIKDQFRPYVSCLRQLQKENQSIVRDINIDLAQKKNARLDSTEDVGRSLQPGEFVWLLGRNFGRGLSRNTKSLITHKSGPFMIHKPIGNNLYLLSDIQGVILNDIFSKARLIPVRSNVLGGLSLCIPAQQAERLTYTSPVGDQLTQVGKRNPTMTEHNQSKILNESLLRERDYIQELVRRPLIKV